MSQLICKNNKANFLYSIIDKYVSGIKLVGSEVKSVRLHNVSINEAYCYINNGEIFIRGMSVAPYKQSGKYLNHEPTRERKLLLNKKEIEKLSVATKQKGLTIIPLSIVINDKGLIKLEIGLAKGKNLYNKKLDIKIRDLDRELKQGGKF